MYVFFYTYLVLGTCCTMYTVQLSAVYSIFPPRLMRRMCTSLNGQQLKVINFIVVYCSCKKRKEMKDYSVKSPASLPPEDTTPDLETWNLELSRVRHRLELSRVRHRLELSRVRHRLELSRVRHVWLELKRVRFM